MARDDDPQDRPTTIPWKLIGFGVVVVVTLLFVLQNREPARVEFLFFETETRQWVNLLIAVVLGVLLDRLFLTWWRRRRD